MRLRGLLLMFLLMPLGAAAQLLDEPDTWFFGLLRHIDRWYLSDLYHFEPDEDEHIAVLISPLEVPLEAGDHSRFYAVVFPEIQLLLTLKRSDFAIPEKDLVVRNAHPKVVAVKRYQGDPPIPPGYQRRELSETAAERLLYEERFQQANWDPELLANVREALKRALGDQDLSGEQIFYLSPHSDYSTDLHLYWENRKQIIIFSSGADFDSEAYWRLLPLSTDVIDLDTDVVSTLLLVPGSNAYVPKSWAARIVYHCVVEGQRLTVAW